MTMPMWSFKNDAGLEVERFYHPGHAVPRTIKVGGVTFTRPDAQPITANTQKSTCWPMLAGQALGCLPKQRQKMIDDSIKRGVPTDFVDEGERCAPKFTSQKHYVEYQKAYGVFNKDSNVSPKWMENKRPPQGG